jgi:CubicO group peptidase (beta-lactamase class C family)
MSRKKLDLWLDEKRLTAMIEEESDTIYNFSMIYKGHWTFTYSNDSVEKLRDIRSITKSVISILIGIAVEQGVIESVHTPIHYFFPSMPKDLTIEELLLMRSGFDIDDIDLSNRLIKSLNWLKDILNLDRTKEKHFSYKSVDYHLLSAIITKAAGMNAARFAEDFLFRPLDIKEFVWLEDPQGHSVGSTGLKLAHESLEKLGLLYLEKGVWNGKRIVPSRWVSRTTKKGIDTGLPYGAFGYGFWIKDYGDLHTYKALGTGGQEILNCPDKDISIIITANPKTHTHEKTENLTRAILESIL